MIFVIAVTTLVNWLFIAIFYFRGRASYSEREANRLRRENSDMSEWIGNRQKEDQQERVRRAYNNGLYDGRQTDTLYRQMLKKYQSGEQVTLIMSGSDGQEERVKNGRDWVENGR